MKKLLEKLKIWSEMIKLEHTIFSAPFMLSAIWIASSPNLPNGQVLFWCSVALLGARSAAMSLNRLIDRQFDALNPRTAQRAIPSGQISGKTVFNLSILGFLLLGLAAFNLPQICLYLLPIAIFWLSFYSFVKRFSWLAHFVLGIALGGAALGGWLAVKGGFSIFAILFSLAISFWVAGFDILYAIQDLEFDQKQKLYSIPACFGLKKALLISKITHIISLSFFASASFYIQDKSYLLGFVVLFFGLIIEHWLIEKDLKNINLAFFTANAWISTLFFLCILI